MAVLGSGHPRGIFNLYCIDQTGFTFAVQCGIIRSILKQEDGTMRKNFGAKPWLYPQPVLIIATYDEDGTPDAMNAA